MILFYLLKHFNESNGQLLRKINKLLGIFMGEGEENKYRFLIRLKVLLETSREQFRKNNGVKVTIKKEVLRKINAFIKISNKCLMFSNRM